MNRNTQASQYVNNLPTNHELIAVSFYATKANGILELERHWTKTSKKGRLGRTNCRGFGRINSPN